MCEVLHDLMFFMLWFANLIALIIIVPFGILLPFMGASYLRDSKKKLTISYPCVMLNVDVAMNNTNDQYQVNDELNLIRFCYSIIKSYVMRCEKTLN